MVEKMIYKELGEELPEGYGYLKLVIFTPKYKEYLVRSPKIMLGRDAEDTIKSCGLVLVLTNSL